jgi:CheY-like chemotaxis protein
MDRFPDVLVVDDDPDIRATIQEVLEMEGFAVETARNGREALDLLKDGVHPCVVLLDLMMPVLTGWEFLEARRASRGLLEVPVVVVSTVAERLSDAGATDVVRKPPDIETLLRVVRKHCAERLADQQRRAA